VSLKVDCPVCGRSAIYSSANRWRPFCSERCKGIDLGQWAADGYTIPGEPADPLDPNPGSPQAASAPRR
jgi:endogenous inhibitor of DNA gyrase (YacG/DUF329 family)